MVCRLLLYSSLQCDIHKSMLVIIEIHVYNVIRQERIIIYKMKEQINQNQCRSRVWQKWQKTRAKYQQQRRLATENSIPSRLQNPTMITQLTDQQKQSKSLAKQYNRHDSYSAENKTSFWDFLKKRGSCTIQDIGWVKIGQPHSYYISFASKRASQPQTSKNISSEPSIKKSLQNRFSSSKEIKNSTAELRQTNKKPASKKFIRQKPVGTINQTEGASIVSTPVMTRRRKMSSGFECRPWSGAVQESMIEYLMARTHNTLYS